MKRRTIISSIVFAAMSFGAQAGLVEGDWKVEGDKKITLHEDTGLEWLDLTETHRMSMSSVEGARLHGDMIESGRFEGFRIPTAEEVYHFMMAVTNYDYVSHLPSSGAPDSLSLNRHSNPKHNENYERAKSLLGETRSSSSSRYVSGYHLPSTHPDENASGRTSIELFGDSFRVKMSDYNRSGYFNSQDHSAVFLVSEGGYTLSSIRTSTVNDVGITGIFPLSAVAIITGCALFRFRKKP